MPELPDVVVYVEALEQRIVGKTLERVRIASPFLLRTISPAVAEAQADQWVAGHTPPTHVPACPEPGPEPEPEAEA